MNDYVTFNQIKNIYNLSKYSLTDNKKIRKLINVGELDSITQGEQTLISTKSFEQYLSKLDKIQTDYLPIYEFLADFTGKAKIREAFPYIKHLKELVQHSCLELIELEYPINTVKYFINKESYQKFKENYISISELYQKTQIYKTIEVLIKALRAMNIKILTVKNRYHLMFVEKEILIQFDDISKGINYKEAIVKLQLHPNIYYDILREYNIKSRRLGDTKVLLRKDFESLLFKQTETYNKLLQNYYTLREINKLYKEESNSVRINSGNLSRMTKIDIPKIARKGKFKMIEVLYLKSDVDRYLYEVKKEREIIQLYDTTTSDFYSTFLKILQIEDVNFSPNASKTKDLWFQFVKMKLTKQRATKLTRNAKVGMYKQTTRLLIDITKEKELFKLTEKELNLCIFNDLVGISFQNEIYSFLYNINQFFEQFGKRIFDLNKLNYRKKRNKPSTKESYTIDEYLSLNSFVCDYERQKKLVIEDIKVALTNIKEYKKLDSMWLYVLLHLNNGWRKSDVINFPRYPSHLFNSYDLNCINSIEKLNLTYEEALKIVNYYKVQWYKHNKTNVKAEFYCSSFLTIPLAYAILICEFRCRMLHLHDEKNLINFRNRRNKIPNSTHDNFFKDFKPNFKFESRKMNRTVLLLTTAVINQGLNETIEIAKHLRGHRDIETSNIYIQIPQEHLNFITKQLFDTGYFGYVYDAVGNLLLGEHPVVRTNRTARSLKIREIFGDIVKLEDTATYLKSLSLKREELGKYLEKVPKEELQKKMNLINMGLSPAKEENYQCFFSSCIANTIDCNKCPFSIPHFYALSGICNRILRTLSNYNLAIMDRNLPEGELSKLTRLFLYDYEKILEAINTFGIEIVEMFMETEYQDFENMVNKLSEPEPRI
jgi:hypothetical protein